MFPTNTVLARAWPRRLAARVAVLLGGCVVLLLAVSLLALRQLSLEPGSEQIADLLAAHVAALRALPGGGGGAALAGHSTDTVPLLEFEQAPLPPSEAYAAQLPFARRLAQRLQQRLGPGSQVLFQDGTEHRIWVSPARPGQPWLAIAVPDFKQQATWLSAIVMLSAIVLISLTALLLSRQIVAPLRRLADAAPALARGEHSAAELAPGAPRELQEMAEALQQAAQQLRASAAERELLLAGLSHDLRTPLARMRLAVEMLRGEDADLLRHLQLDMDELDALVGAFLDLVRQARGEPSNGFDLAALARQAIGPDPEHRWICEGPTELWLRSRPLTVQRVIGNLVENARRHGAAPYRLRYGVDGERAWVQIEDSGPGLGAAPDRLQRAFVRGGDEAPGFGLGLHVCQHLAGALGGELRLENARVGGVCARFDWPVQPER